MKTKNILITIQAFLGLISFVFFVIYATKTEFMPYHASAIGLLWSNVQPEAKPLILVLMKMTSLYFLTIFLMCSTCLIDIIFFKATYILIMNVIGFITSAYATFFIYSFLHNSSIVYPIYLIGWTCILFLASIIILCLKLKQ